MTVAAMIGLGSNLQQPVAQLDEAVKALATIPATQVVKVSSYYRSTPMGPADQPDYVNAVAELATGLDAHALLDALQAIEQQQGRVRTGQRWGPRTLDLDILLYGSDCINDERLQVPHPGMHERNFVLIPLLEICPDCHIPHRGSLQALAAGVPGQGLARLDAGSD